MSDQESVDSTNASKSSNGENIEHADEKAEPVRKKIKFSFGNSAKGARFKSLWNSQCLESQTASTSSSLDDSTLSSLSANHAEGLDILQAATLIADVPADHRDPGTSISTANTSNGTKRQLHEVNEEGSGYDADKEGNRKRSNSYDDNVCTINSDTKSEDEETEPIRKKIKISFEQQPDSQTASTSSSCDDPAHPSLLYKGLVILRTAILIADVPTDHSDSGTSISTAIKSHGRKRKLSEACEEVSGYEADTEFDRDDGECSINSDSKSYDQTTEPSRKKTKFAYDADSDFDNAGTSSCFDDEARSHSHDADHPSTSDTDDEITDLRFDVNPCPVTCVCKSGYEAIPPKKYRPGFRIVTPLHKKLMERRLLRHTPADKDCCRKMCHLRWPIPSRRRMLRDYKSSDLHVYNFSWGAWKPPKSD